MATFSWLRAILGAFLVLVVGAGSAFITHYGIWHPGTFTGWTLWGFLLLMVGVVLVSILAVMSVRGDARWTTPVAFVIGTSTGIGGVFYFQNVNVEWKAAVIGFFLVGAMGVALTANAYLAGRGD